MDSHTISEFFTIDSRRGTEEEYCLNVEWSTEDKVVLFHKIAPDEMISNARRGKTRKKKSSDKPVRIISSSHPGKSMSMKIVETVYELVHGGMEGMEKSRIRWAAEIGRDSASYARWLCVRGYGRGTEEKDEGRKRNGEMTSRECVDVLKLLCPHTLAIGEDGRLVLVVEDGEAQVPVAISQYATATTTLEKEVHRWWGRGVQRGWERDGGRKVEESVVYMIGVMVYEIALATIPFQGMRGEEAGEYVMSGGTIDAEPLKSTSEQLFTIVTNCLGDEQRDGKRMGLREVHQELSAFTGGRMNGSKTKKKRNENASDGEKSDGSYEDDSGDEDGSGGEKKKKKKKNGESSVSEKADASDEEEFDDDRL